MARYYGMENMPSPPLVTPACRLSLGTGMKVMGSGAGPLSGASPWSDAANSLLACPFVLESETKFFKGCWWNGSAAGGNTEVCIYDEAYKLLATTGSTAAGTSNLPSAAALTTQVTLSPGLYYMGIAHSATTTNQLFRWSTATFGIAIWQSWGCWRQSGITLGSLPATATPGDMTNVALPVYGLITRSAFDL